MATHDPHRMRVAVSKTHILLMQLDGSLPNLALARIAGYHREQGHAINFESPRKVE